MACTDTAPVVASGVPPISASVTDGLMRGLQTELDGLRIDNLEQGCELDRLSGIIKVQSSEIERLNGLIDSNEIERLNAFIDGQSKEIERLNGLLRAAQKELKAGRPAPAEAAAAAAAPPPPPPTDEELEQLVSRALTEALASDADSFEDAIGAARRRAELAPTKAEEELYLRRRPAASGVVAAAVRTAKRAQATWATEHSRLREVTLAAQRAAASKSHELDETLEGMRRVTLELGTSRRQLAEAQQRMHRLEKELELFKMDREPRKLQAIPASPGADAFRQARTPGGGGERAPGMHSARRFGSGFATYMEELSQARSASEAKLPPPPPPPPPPPRTLPVLHAGEPQLPRAAPLANAPSAAGVNPALQSMTEALQRQWRQHLNAHMAAAHAGIATHSLHGPRNRFT